MYRVLRYGPLLDVFVLDMRTYRNANSPDGQTVDPQGILGAEQLDWLKRELSCSRADVEGDRRRHAAGPGRAGRGRRANIEAVAQGDPGAPLGRELQIAELLRYIKHRRITGTVWLTADVHYTSAQHYEPARAAFTDFEPFWEFVSGPLNAGGVPRQRARRHLRSGAGLRPGADRGERVARRRLPVLRRGRHRRRQRRADRTAARAGRHRAVHEDTPAGASGPVETHPQ